MCEYDYSNRVASCNETRIYPSGCCPNDACECHKQDCEHGKHRHNKCCEPTTVTCEDGVNRINFCPPCANKCK